MPLVAVGEVRGVDEAEGRWREQFALFALARGRFHQFRRVPLAEIDLDALGFQPALEQINLRGLARPVEALDGDQSSRKIQFGKSLHHSTRPHFLILRNLARLTSAS